MNLEIGSTIYYNGEIGEVLEVDHTYCLILIYKCKMIGGMSYKTLVKTEDVITETQISRNKKINQILSK